MADGSNPVDLNIEEITQDIGHALAKIEWHTWGTAIVYVLFGFVVAGFASSMIGKVLAKHTSAHYTLIVRRLVYYSIVIISVILALTTLQLNMKVLGVATALTLAIGFASQTAVSNIISGLFLVFERPFLIGDHLEYNGVSGELLSIDLMSIKIRTFENTLVRIPNEELLKNQFINLTKFPIRRLDIIMKISLSEDLEKVRKVLFDIARKNPLVLETPPAQMLFEEFTEAAIVIKFAIWVKRESFSILKHSVPYDIQQAFKEHNFKLPAMYYMQLDNNKITT